MITTARDAVYIQGYSGGAMSAIAASVGGAKTTLWRHFPSKPELLVAVIDDLVKRSGRALHMPVLSRGAGMPRSYPSRY